jgi:hypothetical protein
MATLTEDDIVVAAADPAESHRRYVVPAAMTMFMIPGFRLKCIAIGVKVSTLVQHQEKVTALNGVPPAIA